MPLVAVQQYLKGVLNNLPLPYGLGYLQAFIQPPNPGEGTEPGIYIWGTRGDERRRTLPRAQPGDLNTGANKAIAHQVSCWVVWLGPSDVNEPDVDNLFPAIVDTVTATLRNTPLLDQSNQYTDPVTGRVSHFLNTGEDLSWEYGPVRAVADQRYLRYDALVTVPIEEWFQA